jgi:DNA-binding response OmpR family regulator
VKGRVLVVEDDGSIGRAVRDALQSHGYLVDWCTDGASAATAIENAIPDLVLLDAGLPDIDGFTLCRWLRQQHRDLPIVLVTARDSEIDMVVGLDAGASDYVTKPFSMNVLLARVRAHLRNVEITDPNSPIEIGALRVDPAAYVVTVDGRPVDVRRREFQLLLLLCREAGRVVTRERLLADVWDLHWETSTKTLEMHVLALRRKLGDAVEIATVRGVGYRLVVP